jgi:hypothetical protein
MPLTPAVPSTCATLHAAAPPVGFVDVSTFPASSPATHRVSDAHETLLRGLVLSIWATFHAPPPRGDVEVTAFPLLSTATQSDVVGQEMELRKLAPSTLFDFQSVVDPVGLPETITSPTLSIATHIAIDAHETPVVV